MNEDIYKDFANRYDLFFNEFGKHDPVIVDFYRNVFTKRDVKSLLDCACGTGHDLVLFHSLDVEVTGSDSSESMLDQAKLNLWRMNIDIPLFKADFRDLQSCFKGRFDAVACLSSSILHMDDQEEVIRAFRSMYNVLSDNGILILTQGTSDKQLRDKPRFILAFDRDDITRLFVIDYHDRGARYNIIDIYHKGDHKGIKTWHVDYPMILNRDDYFDLLSKSGFNRIETYGSYSFDAYDPDESNILIVIAAK
jgi:glycine/sarcosine N-methyltransferase